MLFQTFCFELPDITVDVKCFRCAELLILRETAGGMTILPAFMTPDGHQDGFWWKCVAHSCIFYPATHEVSYGPLW